jgi:phosphoserine aminotransferase
MSHRSKAFEAINAEAEAKLRALMRIPEDYAVLFLQGGGSLQFAMMPMNLYVKGRPVDVLHTGAWTAKAIADIERAAEVRIAASTEAEKFRRLPRRAEMRLGEDASYVYLCSNNTIEGTQWQEFPETGEVPLVADMSSDILSREVDVARFGLIFAGAQKNLGPAGVTVVIVRRDLAERGSTALPAMLQYRSHIKEHSLYNTPPTFGVYMVKLVLEWVERQGGGAAMEKRNEEKARLLYDAIDSSGGFYTCPVERSDRSRMNMIFRIAGGSETLEKGFAQEAEGSGLVGLAGHRSVGGLRASLYNAVSLEAVTTLISFLDDFQRRHG